MWTHKLIHSGGVMMVTVPRDVARAWDRRGAVYAHLTYDAGKLVIEARDRDLNPIDPAPAVPPRARRGS